VWGCLEDISFITVNSLISISVPGLAQIFMQLFLNLIYIDLLMTDKWFIPLFYKKGEVDFNTKPLNKYFG
jgi:hypothetical protein